MHATRTLLSLLLTAIAALGPAACSQAAVSAKPFVAPGLWQVVSDVQGPMGRHSQLTQQQCWTAQGTSGDALLPTQGGRSGVVTDQVDNNARRSIVHLHTLMQMPQGAMTQDITLVFTLSDSVLHRATMTGHGSMASAAYPVLDETFTQHGHWLAATCPATLAPPTSVTLQRQNIPALTALQNLARQMQAQQPQSSAP